ncbi:unnamed protein product [Peronospora belbahrii]|uniref:Chromo domain-containing protein n=1 Tax=Peronospora belbahrii TaxID=622444 RepID=A0ABN8CU78_9STRA|nr:unnamed protein product [Peronospora belbahrii]
MPGTQVWLYLDLVKEGYAKKLSHLEHEPFKFWNCWVSTRYVWKCEARSTGHSRWYIFQAQEGKEFPDQTSAILEMDETDHNDFDECLSPEYSWVRELKEGGYEVEEILETRSGKKTRYGRQQRELLVRWKGYADPSWVDEVELNFGVYCGILNVGIRRKSFEAMQSREE